MCPPPELKPFETVYFATHSDRWFAGCTGDVVYGNVSRNISCSIRWVNPYIDGEKGKYVEVGITGDERYAMSHVVTQGNHNVVDVSITSV